MSAADLSSLDIAGLAGLIERGEASPVEATEAYLERIGRLNGTLGAYISVYPDQALDAARRAEAEIAAGTYRGPLHGVPLAVKDLFSVAGMTRTCGSRIFEEEAEPADATSVARLRAAGAVILGLLNLHEFAFGPTGVNPHHGTARNPWDTDRVCGGSSSGAGCAVAAGLAAGALGTDTGGSIRLPASLCGVVGVKQTFGLASRHGIYPLCAEFDHGGPLARTVRDAALILQAVAGPDPDDPSTWGAPAADLCADLDSGVTGLRIGVPRTYFFEDLYPGIGAAVGAAIETLKGLGTAVVEVDLPFVEEATRVWTTIALADVHTLHAGHLRDRGDALSPDIAARMLTGADIAMADLVEARWARERIKRAMAAVLERVDMLAVPTAPVPATPVEGGTIPVGGREVEAAQVLGRFTRLASLTSQPAISVPCGFTGEGLPAELPVGLQLIGGWFREADLLRAAHAYEQASPWRERRPPGAA